MTLLTNNIHEHIELVGKLYQLNHVIQQAGLIAADTLNSGGKILFCGNGGSAADSQHLAAELTGKLFNDRRPLAAIALTTDSSTLTCISNDYSFDEVFARQVTGLGQEKDLLIAISTSGNSMNIIRAVEEAKKIGMHTVGLLGRDGGKVSYLCSHSIVVPSENTARIQECHILIGHTICEMIEKELRLI